MFFLRCIMGKILLKRKAMSQLLQSLKGEIQLSPIEVIEQYVPSVKHEDIPDFIYKFEKRKSKKEFGLSANEIVTLSTICELTSLKITSIQNWIKRDVKELIGSPEFGKKYSIEQTALLFIVKDLKAVFDFETIRKMLTRVFNTLSDRSDDLISPLQFYRLYAVTLEEIRYSSIPLPFETSIEQMVMKRIQKELHLNEEDVIDISKVLVIAVMSVLSFHMQLKTIRYAKSITTTNPNIT